MTKTEQIMTLTAPFAHQSQGRYPKILFCCSAGLLRSATCATVAARYGVNARACGSMGFALVQISANLIAWADKIIFMMKENRDQVVATIKSLPDSPENDYYTKKVLAAEVWGVEDVYNYMDGQLVEIAENKISNLVSDSLTINSPSAQVVMK